MGKKRYYIFLDDVWCIRDRTNRRNTYKVGKNKGFALMLCERLNELSDEIGQLKEENDKYRVMINANASLNDEVYEQLKKTEKSYKECREENEQLMEQVQILKKEVRDFLHLCDVCDIQSHISDECTEILLKDGDSDE